MLRDSFRRKDTNTHVYNVTLHLGLLLFSMISIKHSGWIWIVFHDTRRYFKTLNNYPELNVVCGIRKGIVSCSRTPPTCKDISIDFRRFPNLKLIDLSARRKKRGFAHLKWYWITTIDDDCIQAEYIDESKKLT